MELSRLNFKSVPEAFPVLGGVLRSAVKKFVGYGERTTSGAPDFNVYSDLIFS